MTEPQTDSNSVGKKIKALRQQMGISQERLAEMLMVSRQAVTKWESEAGLPDLANIQAIAALFGVSIDYILGDGGSASPVMTINIDREKYPDLLHSYQEILKEYYGQPWKIYPVERSRELNPVAKVFNFIIGWGTLEVADQLSDMSPYYLAQKDEVSLLLNIKDWTLTALRIPRPVDDKKFSVGKMRYRVMTKVPLKFD